MRAGSRRMSTVAALLLTLALAWTAPAAAPVAVPAEPEGTNALGLRLRRLAHLGTILFITAHPDDENNAVLVALARGQGARTALLTATRGEGGQNEIGPETGEALGILRGGELEAIHRRDGAEQYYGRAYDFGFSFSVEETYEKWEKDAILDDFVRVIRTVRPDVIVTLPLQARDGGLHHQAAARLAALAFRAAADVNAFPPEQTGGLEPWQARKMYEGATGLSAGGGTGLLRFETGTADPLLEGLTWLELGARVRKLHRTQSLGDGRRASAFSYRLIDSEPRIEATNDESSFFDVIDTSWARLRTFAQGHERERAAVSAAEPKILDEVRRAQAAFDAKALADVLPPLRSALGVLRRLREEALVGGWDTRVRLEVLCRLEPKETDLMEAIALAHGLRFTATAPDAEVVPGQKLEVVGRITHDGPEPVKIEDVVIHAPEGWTSEQIAGEPGTLAAGAKEMRSLVTVADDAPPTRPVGRKNPKLERYDVADDEHTGRLFPAPPLGARLFFTSGGLLVSVDRPVVREDDAGVGLRRREVSVVPPLSVRFTSPVRMVPIGARAAAPVEVRVTSHGTGAARAVCRLEPAGGWTVRPAQVSLHFTREDEEQTLRFELRPPRGAVATAPAVAIAASVTAAGKAGGSYREERHLVDYPHVTPRRWVRDAVLSAHALDVRVATRPVGYVMGVGDRVPEALDQLGLRVVLLSERDIAAGDLSRFGTIVLGLRAYLRRPELKEHHARVLEYIRRGGHLVVQYNRVELNEPTNLVPYPAVVTGDPDNVVGERLTDEAGSVRLLQPEHPLLTAPNRIGPADFEGWVQERGLSFLDARDPQYEDLLAGRDPFPENAGEKKGMLVTAKVGSGRWTYVGLALWRQLQAGVPGAYRLLANLVSQPAPSKASAVR